MKTPMTALFVILAAALGLSDESAGQVQVLLEEGFSDSDISEWTFEEFLGGAGGVSWSSTEGLPPGALELSSENEPSVRAFTGCIPFGGDQPWSASVDVMPSGARCAIDFVAYYTHDCSDDQIGGQQGGIVETSGVWVTMERELLLDADPAGNPDAVGIELRAGSDGTCFFDNVVIQGTTPRAIPAASLPGLTALGAVIAATALLFLRR